MKSNEIIPHSRPLLDEADRYALENVLSSAQLAQGQQVQSLEEELGRFLALPPGVATSSGTTALHLALLSLGVGPGDEVLLPSYVCSAVLHSVYHAGAEPVLVDVDPETGNMNPSDLKKRLTAKSRAIVVVHLFGLSADLDGILELALPVIEDCAQSLGASLEGQMLGTAGAIAICSFYATKLITTGEGGMLLSSDPGLLARARDLRDYDKRESLAIRFNYKMTDLQAALGRSQLGKLNAFLRQRQALADIYNELLTSAPCALPPSHEGRIFCRYVVSVENNLNGLIQKLLLEGIEVARPVYRPLHRYLNMDGYIGAEKAWNSHLSLPIHPSLSNQDVHRVCHALHRALKENDQ